MIRVEWHDEASVVHAITEAAFGQPDEARLVDALRKSGDIELSLVARVEGGQLVGHCLLSRMQSPAGWLGLAPVSVLPDHQGQGIGSALINEALRRAKDRGHKGVFVLGDPAYYTRFGFSADAAAGFETPYAGPHFMALPLAKTAETAGKAEYAKPFSEL